MSDRIPPPVELVDGQGIGIHLSYLRRDMDEVKVTQQKLHADVISKLNEMQSQYPTRVEFEEFIEGFQKITADHENRVRTLEKSMWKWTGIASAVGVVASILVQLLFKM